MIQSSGKKSTCGGCGKVFSGVSNFDAHRIGRFSIKKYDAQGNFVGWTHGRRCMTDAEMAKLFELDSNGYYTLKKRSSEERSMNEPNLGENTL
jgi:hypothetical protein